MNPVRDSFFRSSIRVVSLSGLLLVMVGAGCGQSTGSAESVGSSVSALSANAEDILGFEVPSDWHVTSGQNIPLTSSSTHTQGNVSLAINAQNFVTIQSATFSVSSAITGPITYDLLLPPPANPYWAGATQMYLDCHSLSIYNQYLGQTELTGVPSGAFTTMSFPLPASTVTALSHGCQDLSVTIALNVPSNSTGTYLLDNLQLDGPPVLTACTQTDDADAGVSTPAVSLSTTLVRPDVGTFVLTSTSGPAAGGIFNSITLDGSLLLQIVSATTQAGSTVAAYTYLPPYSGVHLATATSDGHTETAVFDGRQTVPAPVGAAPSTIQFVDGKPAPVLTVPGAVADAVAELFAGESANTTACFSRLGMSTMGSGVTTIASPPPGASPGHFSNTDQTNGCITEELGCMAAMIPCVYGAAAVSAACGPLAILCGIGGEAFCAGIEYLCLKTADSPGSLGLCCPVACGGEGKAQPEGGCCFGSETCLDASRGLCCTSGTVACMGTECCGPGTQCLPTSDTTSGCCTPEQIDTSGVCCQPPAQLDSSGQCCHSGISNVTGQCCGLFGACSASGTCNGTNTCVNGCCVLG
jgi:hypothetical protein